MDIIREKAYWAYEILQHKRFLNQEELNRIKETPEAYKAYKEVRRITLEEGLYV